MFRFKKKYYFLIFFETAIILFDLQDIRAYSKNKGME